MPRRNNGNLPMDRIDDIEPDDKREIMNNLLALRAKGRPATDDEVKKRIDDFFEYCRISGLRPGVESLGIALGVSRQTVWKWAHGVSCGPKRQELIENALAFIAGFLEQCGMQGKINPVTYIFLMKNWYGYSDSPAEIADSRSGAPRKTREELLEIVSDAAPRDGGKAEF